MKRIALLLILLFPATLCAQIRISPTASDTERYAAQELQRYYYNLYGELLPVTQDNERCNFRLGVDSTLGEQTYTLKSDGDTIAITGGDSYGVLYGVYGLLEDHIGVRFYFSGDVLPENPAKIAKIDDRRTPAMKIRGFLPWTNFPQSATVYSWNDWRYIIDQCAKMRMNFIMIHNYNGFCGHNEMFHNFTYNGHLSRSWMATAKTGHGWGCPGWEVNEYRFGASEIFGDYDFGADCTLHNETLTNAQVFAKGVATFRQVIDYAHSRGVKIGLGLDIDVVLPEYGVDAADEGIVDAQIESLTRNYPALDYLLCFQSESTKDKAFYDRWNKIFRRFYNEYKRIAPQTHIAVSGWGVTAESAAKLPEDVICAPISHYSAACESGEIYGNRQTWGCPWLERDFNSSEYYYPYNMNLSQTIGAYRNRASNMQGFYTLTWRLTDAVSAKMWYVSKAPWWDDSRLDSSRKVYYDFALHNYGQAAADRLIDIIDENELFATDFGECQQTPGFNTAVDNYALLNLRDFELRGNAQTARTEATDYAAKQGTQDADASDGGRCVGFINNGHWLKYKAVRFDHSVDILALRVASASNGGKITVRLDAPDGKELCSVLVKNTGGWQSWTQLRAAIDPVEGEHDLYFCFAAYATPMGNLKAAKEQLALIDDCIAQSANASQRLRLSHLRARTEGVARHIELNLNFDRYTWADLPGATEPWARSFVRRIDDISSLGNVMSTQNRFIQQNYLKKVDELRKKQQVKAPSHIMAKGTATGTTITWRNEEPAIRCFRVYRNGEQITTLPSNKLTYHDKFDKTASYSISAVDTDDRESPQGIPATVATGASDQTAPVIVCISPLSSVRCGEPIDIQVSLFDERIQQSLTAVLKYRDAGTFRWQTLPMSPRSRAAFGGRINSFNTVGLIEYYIEASDGCNRSRFPASENEYLTTVVTPGTKGAPQSLELAAEKDRLLTWNKTEDAVVYKIYRHTDSGFTTDASTFVAFVAAPQCFFRDNGIGFDGKPLSGRYHYTVTAVNTEGRESLPARKASVSY